MNTPFFTVVIPTYNRAELLKEAIRSVLAQTFKDFELIIVDDHSTDHTKDSVALFDDERIKYMVNDRNKGGAGARNAGIFKAKGEWVAFLDADDVWLPQKLDLLYTKIHEVDHATGFIYTGYATYDFDKEQETTLYIPEKEGWIQSDLLYRNDIGTFSAVAIRSNVLKSVGGCDERFCCFHDGDLYVRIAGIARIAFVKEKLSRVRTSNKDRLSHKLQAKLDSAQLFWEKHKEMINKNWRLRHRAASRVFLYSFQLKNRECAYKALPWTLAGWLIDIPNSLFLFRAIMSSIYPNKVKIYKKYLNLIRQTLHAFMHSKKQAGIKTRA